MLRKVCSSVALACIGLVACGGAIQEDDGSGDATGPRTTLSARLAPSNAPWGAWDLVWLEGAPGGKRSAYAFGHLYLDLRPDGKAIARRCTKPYYEPALLSVRCADSQAYDCVYGTVTWDGTVWRVDLPDLQASTKESSGEIVMSETNDGIIVRHILPQYSAGRFARLTDDPPTNACAGS